MTKAKFDRHEVIETSVPLFWRYGFHGTSMQQIFAATGLQPGSVYLAFGNKTELYKEALQHYAAVSLQKNQDVLDSAPTPEHGICNILIQMAEDAALDDFSSCFLVKSQLELLNEQRDLHDLAINLLHRVETLFATHLEPQHGRELAACRATSIMLHIFGMRVYGYHHTSKHALFEGLRQGLPWLPWPNEAHTDT